MPTSEAALPRIEALPERIGLSLSGGGFRAATFHLGTLMYLERVGLLERVRIVSTVSGGTFTGAKYAVSRLDQQPPAEFFTEYRQQLSNGRIFPHALELLSDDFGMDNASGRKNIITCAAQSYCETFFCRDVDSPILFGELLQGDTGHLEEIIFNATDFRTGLAFRFQRSRTGWIGNRKSRIDPSDAAQIRLGDIVAASSCFPGGFEPIEFPGDFTWPEGIPAGVSAAFATPSPLMDGGVYDNQGLESLLMAAERTGGVDMIIMSDADRQSEALFQMPAPGQELQNANWLWRMLAWFNPSLGMIDASLVVLLIVCALSVIAIGYNLWLQLNSDEQLSWFSLVFTNLIPFVTTAGTAALIFMLRSLFRSRLLSQVPQLHNDAWKYLRKVRLLSLTQMLLLRATSLLSLVSTVFMKRIRSTGYRNLYDDQALEGKLVANYIYAIRRHASWIFAEIERDTQAQDYSAALIQELKSISPPSTKVVEVAETAARVPTLLWFENDQQLRTLIAAGQITTCLNLLKFLARTRTFDDSRSEFADPAVAQLWQTLKRDWQQFQLDPFHFETANY